ncbi:MAG: ABC transporter permease [Parcubacteria group bacterium]|nr:ABC transporter permease [Parcubacteria group bacterium]
MELNKENIIRVINQGWVNFKRNSWLAFGTIGIMALALLIFSGLVAFNIVSQTTVAALEEKVDVTAYLKTDVSDDQARDIARNIEALSGVTYVNYVSRVQALENFKKRHESEELVQQALLELGDNPLQASLEIKAGESSQYAGLVGFIENSSFRELIDKIDFYENETVINRLQKISSGLRTGGILVTLILSVIAVLVTFNTIRLTIYSQKQEIEIMRLVGASNWHIRGPYVVEGAIYGIIAGFAVLIIFYPAVFLTSPKIQAFIPSVNLASYFSDFFSQMLILVLGLGIALGVVSSMIAVRRYLKI